jgi:hypothetical protein
MTHVRNKVKLCFEHGLLAEYASGRFRSLTPLPRDASSSTHYDAC